MGAGREVRPFGFAQGMLFPVGEFTLQPTRPDLERLIQSVDAVHGVIHCWSLDTPEMVDSLEEASIRGCGSTLYLLQALLQEYSAPPSLWLVSRGTQAVVNENEEAMPGLAQSPLWGMGQVIALEHPELQIVQVDLDPGAEGVAADAQMLFE